MSRLILLLLGLSLFGSVYGGTTGEDYAADKAIVDNAAVTFEKTRKAFSPSSVLPHYDPNPSAEQNYPGVTGDADAMASLARQHLSADKAGGTVFSAFKTRPKININKDSPDFADSTLAENDSYNITHGISDQYVNCHQGKVCKTVMTDVHCVKTNTISVHCTKTPRVRIVTEPFSAPIPNPCTHVVAVLRGQKPPAGAVLLARTENWYRYATLYQVAGPNADKACYIPGSIHVEHDRNQHGTSAISALAEGTYFFYGQAWYYKQQGYADLYVQTGGKTVVRVQARANQGNNHTVWRAVASGSIVLNGYNHGFDNNDYDDAYSAYWAAAPLVQTHQVAKISWYENCGVGDDA